MKNKTVIPVGGEPTPAPSLPIPVTQTPVQRAAVNPEFIIVIRSSKGTLHAVNDQRKGPGALATFENLEDAVLAAGLIPDCQRFQSYFIPVE